MGELLAQMNSEMQGRNRKRLKSFMRILMRPTFISHTLTHGAPDQSSEAILSLT